MMLRITSVIIAVATTFLIGFTSYANEQPELIKMRATAYCLQGITCTGDEVREGIAATGRKDLIGTTIILYQRLPNGDVGKGIGIYEVKDSGCNENVIDVWKPDLDACQEFMDEVYKDGCKGKIYCEVINADG